MKESDNQSKQGKTLEEYSPQMRKEIQKALKKRAKRRKMIQVACSLIAVGCFAYLIGYNYFADRTDASYDHLKELKDKEITTSTGNVTIHYTKDQETPDILEEYRNLYNSNKSLIGWVKIEDTNIDYPVMQTVNNEYYLTHNISQDYDKNGIKREDDLSIFLDCECDVLKPSTNLIIYGHHMKSGKMFGQLDKYKEKDYWEKHPYIQFDTIYEKGIRAGALGGKLLGAGGGGFFIFYVQPDKQQSVRNALKDLLYIPFSFEDGGTRVIHYTPETYEPVE